MIEMETSVEVLCIRIMIHPQVLGQKFTPIRRFLGRDLHPSAGFWASKTHPFWPHIPNMTQNGSAPPQGIVDQNTYNKVSDIFIDHKKKLKLSFLVVENNDVIIQLPWGTEGDG